MMQVTDDVSTDIVSLGKDLCYAHMQAEIERILDFVSEAVSKKEKSIYYQYIRFFQPDSHNDLSGVACRQMTHLLTAIKSVFKPDETLDKLVLSPISQLEKDINRLAAQKYHQKRLGVRTVGVSSDDFFARAQEEVMRDYQEGRRFRSRPQEESSAEGRRSRHASEAEHEAPTYGGI